MGLPLQAKGISPVPVQPATTKSAKSETKETATAKTPAKSHSDRVARTTPSGKNGKTPAPSGRLARLTAYWAGEGDYYTGKAISATGIHLHGGHCAVDPSIIPYGSVVEIAGLGKYLAVDTGSAVISRTAAREAAHTTAEHNALVIDLFFESRKEGQQFAASGPKYASISWTKPDSVSNQAKEDRSLFADENWTKIKNKQL